LGRVAQVIKARRLENLNESLAQSNYSEPGAEKTPWSV
jgi:hypothetical protein